MHSSPKLPNYLRTYRKRIGLSQEDLAFLLGCRSGAKVCRYERFSRVPTLRVALAYEVIFRAPARDLFGGLQQKVEQEVSIRAEFLARKLAVQRPGRLAARKLEMLKTISAALPTHLKKS
jgi:transcriptional regulator with XRE-family HTH domain